MPDPRETAPASPHNPYTPEKVALLEAGPGLVTNPAGSELLSPEDYVEVRTGRPLGNFPAFFLTPTNLAAVLYRQAACWQRFAILYPEQVTRLETLANESPREEVVGRPQQDFFTAYDQIRQLVDRSDFGVTDSKGAVDPLFLFH